MSATTKPRASPRARAPRRKPNRWGPGHPTRCTEPLSDDFTTDADWFLPIIRRAWAKANQGFELDVWQVELIRRCLETYPPGHPRAGDLRFRQVVISLARQNGKSVIGAILGIYGLLYGLLRSGNPAYVIGIASSAEQARIIYDRTNDVIASNPALRARFKALTDTRGIRAVDGGKYEIKAAKANALQGLAITLGMVDELHIIAASLWQALVSGTGGRNNCIVVGITTAGDDDSELLLQLYANGEKAIAGVEGFDRFGFFVWEAPEARVPTRKAELVAYLKAANPSLAEGRIPLENVLSDIAGQHPGEVIRYRLNRFTARTASFVDMGLWALCARPYDAQFPEGLRPTFAIDRSPDWGYATVTVAARDDKGITHTEIVASIVKPTLEGLIRIAIMLFQHNGASVIVDSYGLKEVALELRRRGYPVTIAGYSDVIGAAALLYSKIARRTLRHASDPLLSQQLPLTVRKNVGDQFTIARQGSSVEIDAVRSLALAVRGAETAEQDGMQVF